MTSPNLYRFHLSETDLPQTALQGRKDRPEQKRPKGGVRH